MSAIPPVENSRLRAYFDHCHENCRVLCALAKEPA